jgi:hypothetical protein
MREITPILHQTSCRPKTLCRIVDLVRHLWDAVVDRGHMNVVNIEVGLCVFAIP